MMDNSQEKTPEGVPEGSELGDDIGKRAEAERNKLGSRGPMKGNGDR